VIQAAPRRRTLPNAVLAAIAAAWLAALVSQTTGTADQLHHDSLLGEGGPPWAALFLFLVAWQVMIAAMMLPSSMPMIRYFAVVSARQDRPRAAFGAFLGGYAFVWTAFGALALTGDLFLHGTVNAVPWLEENEWVISGAILAAAGAFQFTSLKDRCLEKCRHPALFLMKRYQRGVGEAFSLGQAHGVFCLGCCWALMLLVFAAGFASLAWMAGLAAVMYYEKAGRHGARVVRPVGIVLLAWAGLVLAHPGWLPAALSGVS
jgi:predicted metal-binding membrane protein